MTRYDDNNHPYIDGGHCDYVCGYCASPCSVGSEVTNLPVRKLASVFIFFFFFFFLLQVSFRVCPEPVLSCLVLSCLVLSCLVLSCLVLSCPVLSCLGKPESFLRFSKRKLGKQKPFRFCLFRAQEIAVDRSIYAFTCGGCPLGRTDLDLDAFTPCSECLAGCENNRCIYILCNYIYDSDYYHHCIIATARPFLLWTEYVLAKTGSGQTRKETWRRKKKK
eukprot:COSAG06_NODE_1538_length_9150_cov_102.886200_12_plen_219_part_01